MTISKQEFDALHALARGTIAYIDGGGQPIPWSNMQQMLAAKLIIDMAPSVGSVVPSVTSMPKDSPLLFKGTPIITPQAAIHSMAAVGNDDPIDGPSPEHGTGPEHCAVCGTPFDLVECVDGEERCSMCIADRARPDTKTPLPENIELLVHLTALAKQDVAVLGQKDAEYGSSWKIRGGVGAYMMLARKWDRLETACKRHGWDVFAAARTDTRTEGILDDIRDLRRYLLLVESEVL